MGLTIVKKKAREGAGEYRQFRQLQVRRPYIGGIHPWTGVDKQFSARHKLTFGPRATARAFFFLSVRKLLSKVASIFMLFMPPARLERTTIGLRDLPSTT